LVTVPKEADKPLWHETIQPILLEQCYFHFSL